MQKMKKIKSEVLFLGLFLFYFLLIFFLTKLFGDGYRGQVGGTLSPMTWQECISNIPRYALLSGIFTLLLYCLHRYQSRKDREQKP